MRDHMTTRRVFLQKGLTLLAVTPTIPTFVDQTVLALAQPFDTPLTQMPSGSDGRVLVIVQLSGGNDGLSTVIPYADDAYHKVRPNLRRAPDDVLKIDGYFGLHPNLAPVKELFDDGQMAIVHGVGYPNPNRSHFRSMDIWQSGQPDKEVLTSGWVGRYFDNTCDGCDPHVGVSLGDTLPLAMRGQRVTPLAFERPENYRYNGPERKRYVALNEQEDEPSAEDAPAAPARSSIFHPPSSDSQLNFLTRTAMDAQVSSDRILKMTSTYKPGTQYPANQFGQGLRTIAAMIAGGLPTRVYYVALGGFDTHANQRGRHDQLMSQFANGVSAFWKDMRASGHAERVALLTFSEFGRRVQQNASQGTDHGAAAPMFLFGPAVRQAVVGRHPSLTQLEQGDLRYGIDFRSVYATILQEWMQTPSKPILGGQFPTLRIFKRG